VNTILNSNRSKQGVSLSLEKQNESNYDFYNSDIENPNRNQYLVLRENVYLSSFDF